MPHARTRSAKRQGSSKPSPTETAASCRPNRPSKGRSYRLRPAEAVVPRPGTRYHARLAGAVQGTATGLERPCCARRRARPALAPHGWTTTRWLPRVRALSPPIPRSLPRGHATRYPGVCSNSDAGPNRDARDHRGLSGCLQNVMSNVVQGPRASRQSDRGIPIAPIRRTYGPKWREGAEVLAATGESILSSEERYGPYLDTPS